MKRITSAAPPDRTWAGYALSFVNRHGVIAAIAVFLVVFVAYTLAQKVDALAAKIDVHAGEMTKTDAEQKTHDLLSLALLRAICYGVNKSDEARAMCDVGRDGR